MLIDWFTVGAQSLNFLLLVYLLKRFLYQPILHAIDAREKIIADKLAAAEQLKMDAEQQRQTFEDNNREFSEHKQQLLQEAVAAAKAQKEQLLTEAKATSDLLRQKAMSGLDKEIQSLQEEIARQSLQHIYANSQKVLEDLAGLDLQQAIFEVFIKRLKEHLDQPPSDDASEQTASLHKSIKQAQTSLTLRSALPLSEQQQGIIKQCLTAASPALAKAPAVLKFVVEPQLICGVELLGDGWKLSWTSENYLANLQSSGKTLVKLLPKNGTEQAGHQQLIVRPKTAKDVE
jgi:F-type H+-transporting ATPase subunit b